MENIYILKKYFREGSNLEKKYKKYDTYIGIGISYGEPTYKILASYFPILKPSLFK